MAGATRCGNDGGMADNTSESTSSTPPAPAAPPPSNPFFTWMRGLGITREPGWLGGVAAGVGVRLGIDPILVRGIFVVVALIGAPALLLYAAAWLLLPDLEGRIHLERLARGQFDGAIIGIGVVAVLAFLPVTQGLWFWGPWNWDVWGGGRFLGGALWNLLWTLAIIGSIVWLIVWLATRNGTTRTPHDSVLYTAPPADSTAGPTDAGTTRPGSATSAAFVADTAAPVPPSATPPTDADALDEWKRQQEEWKREHAAWKAQQAEVARERAAHERRVRAEQAAAQRTELAEQYRRTRSHPLFSLVAIGVALVAGAVSALVVVGAGDWSTAATQVGLAVALGVLGLAVIINGLMGKRQGGAGGMAWLVAFALLVTSIGGIGGVGSVGIRGEQNLAPSYADSSTFAHNQISGIVNLDLTDYFDGSPATAQGRDGRVTLRLVSGDANIIVPADARTIVHASVVSGTIQNEEGSIDSAVRSTNFVYPPRRSVDNEPTIRVNVWVVSGTITLTQADS